MGWQKPTKVARRHSFGGDIGVSGDDAATTGSGFSALGPLGEDMDLGLDDDSGPHDAFMANPLAMSLKRAHSPPKSPISNCPRPAVTKVSSAPSASASNQVSSLSSCMVGG